MPIFLVLLLILFSVNFLFFHISLSVASSILNVLRRHFKFFLFYHFITFSRILFVSFLFYIIFNVLFFSPSILNVFFKSFITFIFHPILFFFGYLPFPLFPLFLFAFSHVFSHLFYTFFCFFFFMKIRLSR